MFRVIFSLLQNYIPDLANIIKNYDDEEFVIECVGILGNINISDLDYSVMLKEYDLLNYIKGKLTPGAYITILYYLYYILYYLFFCKR